MAIEDNLKKKIILIKLRKKMLFLGKVNVNQMLLIMFVSKKYSGHSFQTKALIKNIGKSFEEWSENLQII